jgi:hypothetical protein
MVGYERACLFPRIQEGCRYGPCNVATFAQLAATGPACGRPGAIIAFAVLHGDSAAFASQSACASLLGSASAARQSAG